VPTFSVIIPTYNRSSYLNVTLESVWRQTLTDYEIIVVDDGSTDDTSTCLSQFSERVAVVKQPNYGPSIARNKGAENARGEYLAFLDSDDLWFPWTLETVAQLITRHDRPAIISARLVSFNDPAELESVNQTPTTTEVFSDFLSSSERDFFVGAGMTFVRRDKFLEVGGFTGGQMNLEDHDLILKLGTAEGFVQILEPPTLGWRRHSTSLTDQSMRSFQGCKHLIESEQRGVYPGGKTRAVARRRIITRHIRPWALTFARRGEWQLAWSLYKSTFIWNLSLYRWRYLVGFWPSFHESVLVAHSRR
jgi:glycosyltransferase involved in cell wall biosynthesis